MRDPRLFALALTATLIGGVNAGHAGLSASMAATCTVGDPAIQNNLYTIASGTVRHTAGKVGLITLYCPISPTITQGGGSYGGWYMSFVDPDKSGKNYYIQSQIIRSDLSGHVAAVSGVLSSNSSTTNYIESGLTHNYDFADYYYYVRVDLYRGDTAALPIFVGVGVTSEP